MMSDVARTSRSHGDSKYKLFESSGNASSFAAKHMCYSSEVVDDAGNDSVMDTMSVLIQKLLIENKSLKDENKLLRASHSQGVFKESFLESVRLPLQRSYAQVVADNSHYAEAGFERKCGKRIRKKNLKACQFCGGIHRWGKDRCPAFGNKCRVCLKMNHLDDVCFYSKFSKLRKARSLPVSLDQRKNCENVSDGDIEVINEIPKLVVMKAAADKTEDVNEDTKLADLVNVKVGTTPVACKNGREVKAGDVSEVEQIVPVVKSYEKATDAQELRMNVGAAAVGDVSHDCMEKKDQVLQGKEIMEKDKIQSKQSDIRSLEKAEKIIKEDKAEKQSWLDIEDGTKFPLWAAYIKANPEMKVQFPEKGGCDVFSI